VSHPRCRLQALRLAAHYLQWPRTLSPEPWAAVLALCQLPFRMTFVCIYTGYATRLRCALRTISVAGNTRRVCLQNDINEK